MLCVNVAGSRLYRHSFSRTLYFDCVMSLYLVYRHFGCVAVDVHEQNHQNVMNNGRSLSGSESGSISVCIESHFCVISLSISLLYESTISSK